MSLQSKHRNLLFLAASVAVLTACGAEEISSPGSGGNINITNNTPPPPPPPPPPTVTLVTPAPGCPTIDDPAGLKDLGTITGPTGTYRNCELPARITRSSRLSKIPGLLYSIGGRVDVGTDLGAAVVAGQTSITLTILAASDSATSSVIDQIGGTLPAPAAPELPAATTPLTALPATTDAPATPPKAEN